jgi:mannose/fructose-specific phosphotransferase system component IIA
MFGPQTDAVAMGLAPDETREDFQARVHAARAGLSGVPLVLVDLACGTPWNVAVLDGCAADQGEVLAGLNLPLLLESLELRQTLAPKALGEELKARGCKSFVQASRLIAERGNGSCA